jgi:hypothetical protein
MSYRNAALLSLANNELLNENEYSMKKITINAKLNQCEMTKK